VLAENIELALTGLEFAAFPGPGRTVVEQLRSWPGARDIVRDDTGLAMLDGIRSRYTMKSERDDPSAVFKAAGRPVADNREVAVW